MQTLTQNHRRLASSARLTGRPGGALARLISASRAPVIGLAGTGPTDVCMSILAEMLRADGRLVAEGMIDALAQAKDLGAEDRILVELAPPLLRQVPQGLSSLVLCGLAPDDLAPGLAMGEAVDGLRRAVAGARDAIVVNADDARALALAAEARVEVMRVASSERGADVTIRGGEMILIDPFMGVERRVCRMEDSRVGTVAYRSSLLLAAATAAAAGVSIEAIRAVAGRFKLGPGRLERLIGADGSAWICDSAAQRPGLAAASLRAFSGERIILVAGGRHGGQSLERWARAASEAAEYVLVYGSAAATLAAAMAAVGGASTVVRCADLADAVSSAPFLANGEQRLLFSPACEADQLEPPSPDARFRLLLAGIAMPRSGDNAVAA